MTHPWSSLCGALFVHAFAKARELHIPPQVSCGSALRCAAEVTLALGVSEAEWLEVARRAYQAAAEARTKPAPTPPVAPGATR